MITPVGWFVNPADDRVMRAARLLADERVAQFKAYESAELTKRSELRDRMGMIITIDRAGTNRSIANQY
jgi:hypothetical protein